MEQLTAFGNWTETSDPGRALVFTQSWTLVFIFSDIDCILVSQFHTVCCAAQLPVSAIPHCVCVVLFLIYILTFHSKLSRILPIQNLPYSWGRKRNATSDRMKAFVPMHCYMEKHWVKIQLTGTSQKIHCSKIRGNFCLPGCSYSDRYRYCNLVSL